MSESDIYEAWKQRRAEIQTPDDFTDRVMASLPLHEERPARQRPRLLHVLLGSAAFRVGICSLACAAGLLRVLQVIALFFVEQPSR